VKAKTPLGDNVSGAPYRIGCNFLNPNTKDYLHVSDYDFEGSVDFANTDFAFAASYNQTVSRMLKAKFPTECGRQAKSK
jgi:hypothetical protein